MNIAILGVTGMLGSTLFRYFSINDSHHVYGAARNLSLLDSYPKDWKRKVTILDVAEDKYFSEWLSSLKPDVVINCIGIIKQLKESENSIQSIKINSLFPHQIASICNQIGARLIHFGTDCVFSGIAGNYREQDLPDARDLYGLSKLLGEVTTYPNVLTLRTSIIGHELKTQYSLIDWFLGQSSEIRGYRKAIFSGLPTYEIARILDEFVLPNVDLSGLYHLSAEPIDKYTLLSKIKKIYNKNIVINPDDSLVINRSLDSSQFRLETGYQPLSWDRMLQDMYAFRGSK